MWSVILLVVVIVFALTIKPLSTRKIPTKKSVKINYQLVPSLITDAEKRFLTVLDNAAALALQIDEHLPKRIRNAA